MLKKTVGRAPAPGKGLFKALLWGAGWTIGASMAVAWMLGREMIRMEQTGYAAMIILLICGVLLAQQPSAETGKQKLVQTGVAIGAYFVCLLLVNCLMFGGNVSGFGVTIGVLVAGGLLGNFRKGKGRGKSGPRRYKIPKP